MNFLKTSILSGFKTLSSILSGLIVNKLIAITIGSQGFAVIGQFRDILQIGQSIGQLGFQNGIVKNISQHKANQKKIASVLSTAIKSQLIATLGFALLLILFREQIVHYLIGHSKYAEVLILIAIGMIPNVIFNSIIATLNGLKDFKRLVSISILSNIVGVLINIYLIYTLHLKGALIGMALNLIVPFIVLLFFFNKSQIKFSWFKAHFDKKIFKQLSGFFIMFITSTLSMSLTLLAIRKHLIVELGLNYAGFWESLWRLSKIYVTFLASSFSLYILPTFSEISPKYLRKEVFKIWRITIPLTIVASTSIYLLKDFLITLVYSKDFLIIGSLMAFQLIGDAIKINSNVLGNILVAKAHVKSFVLVQIFWALTFYICMRIFTVKFGFEGVAIAYLISYLLHFVFMNLYFRKLLWTKLS